jgi:hypothetical protein
MKKGIHIIRAMFPEVELGPMADPLTDECDLDRTSFSVDAFLPGTYSNLPAPPPTRAALDAAIAGIRSLGPKVRLRPHPPLPPLPPWLKVKPE